MSDKRNTKTSIAQFVEAFLEYLGRPKTVFDLKDRTRALIFFGIIIYVLQKVVEIFAN